MASGELDAAGSAVADPFEGTAYRAVRRVGGGGMGDVFVVEHLELGRQLAAKVLRAESAKNPQLVDRVRVEAQALGRLSHRNIVSVLDFAKTRDGRPFIVMELLQGETLAEALKLRGALPVTLAVAWATDLLAALEATHRVGLVHRDVKPSNVFLALQRDGTVTLKLIDFGVTRVLPEAPPSAPAPLAFPTDTGEVVGTPRYVSPEGAAGDHVDARADVYAAALVLYAMLAGRGPFDDVRGAGPLRAAHLRQKPDPPSRFARDPVPAELDAVVLRALEKDPSARFGSAAEARQRLLEVAELLARPAGWLETRAFSREHAPGAEPKLGGNPRHELSTPAPRTGRTGAPAWLFFAVGLIVAALAVAALRGLFDLPR
jgi:eukaryotic-like serine/threonine-protein kinase